MSSKIAEAEIPWLTCFFSGANRLHWQQIVSGDAPPHWLPHVTPWLKFLETNNLDRPVVLPVFDENGPSEWYAMAADEHIAAMLAEELTSLVGPSYSDFRGEHYILKEESAFDSALRGRFGNSVFKFRALTEGDKPEIARLVLLYQGVLARRPPLPDRAQRPFGVIRRDFDHALLTGNESRATNLLAELCDSGRVSSEQRKCLEIRLLAGLGRFDELARNRSLIAAVVDLSLPPQTISDLVEALYGQHIAPIEAELEFEGVVAVFKEHISKPFGSLFRERKGVRQPRVLRAFLLFEATQSEPNRTRCEGILAAYPEGAEGRALAERWLSSDRFRRVVPEPSALDLARQAILDEDYEIAVDLCFQAIPNPWAYSALLRCAIELNSTSISDRVLDAVSQAPATVLRALSAKDQTRLEKLRAPKEVAEAPAKHSDWIVWAQWVVTGNYEQPPISILETAVVRWCVDDYIHDPTKCDELAHLIGNSHGQAERVFRDTFPYLVEFFVDRPSEPVRAFTSMYSTLLKVVAWSGAVSEDELELASTLAQALLSVGPTRELYIECVDDLCEIVSANNSSLHMDWALNTAELLALYPSQDRDLRLRFFVAVMEMAYAIVHRLTEAQRAVLEILARDYDCLPLLERLRTTGTETEARSVENSFGGLIGIYTLTETAGQRAKNLLKELLPRARIELNGDKVATDRLKRLAKDADIFVFSWKSSKHQAYYCAKDARSAGTLKMSPGKGTASIVSSVLEELQLLN